MTLANILTASLLLPAALGLTGAVAAAQPSAAHADHDSPQVALWTNHGDDLFERGDGMTVYLRTDVDAFVSVFQVDADGLVRVLFPRSPFEDAFTRGGRAFAVPGAHGDETLRVEEYPGEGFLFVLVTLDPIAFGAFARNGGWDYAALGLPARVTDDPYLLFSALLAALVPESYDAYGYAVAPYYVEARHAYPRFMCYQCHAYVPPDIWDPYAHSCIRVRVSEPLWWRYPGDRYGGTVVVSPPRAVPPRYVIEPRQPAKVAQVGPRDRRPAASPATATGRRPAPAVREPPRRGQPETPARTAPRGRTPTRDASPAAPAAKPSTAARPGTGQPPRASSAQAPRKSGREPAAGNRGSPGARPRG
jgi:hypothetical protein